jgi:hypothetical protein
MRIIDLQAGARVQTIRFGGGEQEPIALAVVPGIEGGEGYAVLMEKADGRSKLVMRKPDGSLAARTAIRVAPIDLERLGRLAGTGAAEVAVFGVRPSGRLVTITLDPLSTERISKVNYGAIGTGVDLETLSRPTRQKVRRTVVLVSSEDGTQVVLADALRGRVIHRLSMPIGTPIDLETLPDLDGSGGAEVAVFGRAADGVTSAIVADPHEARLMAGPVFDAATVPIDLTVIPGLGDSGAALASLGTRSAYEALISLRDAGSGAPIGEISIP